jgi:hypothetical protein
MDRGNLAAWSLEVPDSDFAPALVALGALASLPQTILEELHRPPGWIAERIASALHVTAVEGNGLLEWTKPDVSVDGGIPVVGSVKRFEAPSAQVLVKVFRTLLSNFKLGSSVPQGLRLAIRTGRQKIGGGMPHAWLLASADPKRISSVFLIDAFPSDGRADWKWPLTIATLPGDPLAIHLASHERTHDNWPIHYVVASRDVPNVEVLVISATVADGLMRLLASGLRLRCCLVVVVGLGIDTAESAEPLINTLVGRLSAEGVAILAAGKSAEDFARRINQFAFELTHNKPLDVALIQPFGRSSLLLLSRDLLAVSRLEATLDRATSALRRLPSTASIELSDRSSDRLQLSRNLTRSRPPAEIADAIDLARSNYAYIHEIEEASAITELAGTVERKHRESRQAKKELRYLRQESFQKIKDRLVEVEDGYTVGQAVMVSITIGPRRDGGSTSPTAFPEDKLPKQRAPHRLQVLFHEPEHLDEPMLRDIMLPPTGDSSAAEFVFTPRAARNFEARVSVLHRGRVLQTVLMKTVVLGPGIARGSDDIGIWFDKEIRVRQNWEDLRRRRRFDMALVFNHSAGGEARMTGVTGQRAWAKNLQGLEKPVRRINELLSEVATTVLDYDGGLGTGGNPKLLVELACVGADLYSALYLDQLKELTTESYEVGIKEIEYLQIISARQDAVVPIEFFYDYDVPRPGAAVCPGHDDALKKGGRCPSDCPRSNDPEGFVCPLGFWGVKKVIERHMYDPKVDLPAGAEIVIQSEATEGRDRLNVRLGLVVGHSQEVKSEELKPLLDSADITFGPEVTVVKNWDEWRGAVKDKRPTMLLAFPHNAGKEEQVTLEIGGNALRTNRLPRDYVKPEANALGPMVFLLGCDVAGTAQDFSSHIRYFRQAGAAIIVSTVATVFGPHAVHVGHAIVKELTSNDRPSDATVGQVMLDAKRQALRDSVPMALCVVAYGDADWRI